MSEILHVGKLSDVGRRREENEDRLLAYEIDGAWLLVVCDGMGGHEDGATASQVASLSLHESLSGAAGGRPDEAIEQALHVANAAVATAAAERGGSNMGTTAVVARIVDGELWHGWVGDSRLYVIRDGEVVYRTRDHTLVAEEVAQGRMTEEEARNHPASGTLTMALTGDIERIEPSVPAKPIPLERGDVVLLCSDGLYDLVSDADLCRLVAGRTPEEAATELVETANDEGGIDNISVIVGSVGEPVIPAVKRRATERMGERPWGLRWIALVAGLMVLAVGVGLGLGLGGRAPEIVVPTAPKGANPLGPLTIVTPAPYRPGQSVIVRSLPTDPVYDSVVIEVDAGAQVARYRTTRQGAGFEATILAPDGPFELRAVGIRAPRATGRSPVLSTVRSPVLSTVRSPVLSTVFSTVLERRTLRATGCEGTARLSVPRGALSAGERVKLDARMEGVSGVEALVFHIADESQLLVTSEPRLEPGRLRDGSRLVVQVGGTVDGRPVCAGPPAVLASNRLGATFDASGLPSTCSVGEECGGVLRVGFPRPVGGRLRVRFGEEVLHDEPISDVRQVVPLDLPEGEPGWVALRTEVVTADGVSPLPDHWIELEPPFQVAMPEALELGRLPVGGDACRAVTLGRATSTWDGPWSIGLQGGEASGVVATVRQGGVEQPLPAVVTFPEARLDRSFTLCVATAVCEAEASRASASLVVTPADGPSSAAPAQTAVSWTSPGGLGCWPWLIPVAALGGVGLLVAGATIVGRRSRDPTTDDA